MLSFSTILNFEVELNDRNPRLILNGMLKCCRCGHEDTAETMPGRGLCKLNWSPKNWKKVTSFCAWNAAQWHNSWVGKRRHLWIILSPCLWSQGCLVLHKAISWFSRILGIRKHLLQQNYRNHRLIHNKTMSRSFRGLQLNASTPFIPFVHFY